MKDRNRYACVCLFSLLGAAAAPAIAQDESGGFSESSGGELEAKTGWLDQIDWDIGGFLRTETAFSTTGEENPNNQGGNTFQDRTVHRQAYLPPTLGVNLVPWGAVPLPYADNLKRSDFVPSTQNDFNYTVLRGETEIGIKFGSNFDFITRIRALYQPDQLYDEFNAGDVADLQGGITGGHAALYRGTPNYFDYYTEKGKHSMPLEWTGSNYQVYIPAFVFNYHEGGLNFRVGNQQIAWGQALFLRTFDVPNGLDLRRHLILDRALEEFSDKRVPMLSARLGYQMTDEILFDSYVGKFQPTVFGNPNTPYNLIPTQFTVHDRYEDKWSQISAGFRLKAEYGNWGWQAAYARRYNPDGVFSWTESGVVKSFQGPIGSVGNVVNIAYAAKLPGCSAAAYNPTLCRLYSGTDEALSHTPFEASPAGVYSANEWFDYAAMTRLSAIDGLNSAIEEFPALRDVYTSVADNKEQAMAELNTVFMAGGGSLRGHIQREYFVEHDIMLGGSYVNESDNDFLNQLIFNLEAQYTPKRRYTAPSLSQHYIEQDEYTISLVVDKWHRFFQTFPGTYIVFEAETKQRSDLVGRSLKGFGGSEDRSAPGRSGNANYFVFGFTQPFPNKRYEVEFAMLYDLAGGVLMQPGGRFNPGHGLTFDLHYNYLNGNLYGRRNDNVISSVDYDDELSLRMTYQF